MVPPLTFTLHTSEEELKYLYSDKKGEAHTYEYTKSETKKGFTVTHKTDWLERLITIQTNFKPVDYFDTNFIL